MKRAPDTGRLKSLCTKRVDKESDQRIRIPKRAVVGSFKAVVSTIFEAALLRSISDQSGVGGARRYDGTTR
jgi:hypothetical protein